VAQTFFFYDLETSGFNSRTDRIMQFAGQRTDMDLQPIGEPVDELIALGDDTIPSPGALLVTGLTPQKTLESGWKEAEFSKKLLEECFTPDTIVVGYNNIRFDDEFIRHLLWRNFQDPYEWAWRDGRSRWDLLDVARMTRALRPAGIEWPVDEAGEPTNRLESISTANKIEHQNAHDALSDVMALINIARLLKTKQPQLFEYLLTMRDKKAVLELVNLNDKRPFVYTSGRYDKQFHKTTVAVPLTSAPHGNLLVYDLRHDPRQFLKLSQAELESKISASYEERQAEDFVPLPVKVLQPNRCPAVAPLGVLSKEDGWQRLGLEQEMVQENVKVLLEATDFAERLRTIFENKQADYQNQSTDVEERLYDSLLPDADKIRLEAVRNSTPQQLADFQPEFIDERLPELLVRYKARNFPQSLSESEMQAWEEWRSAHLEKQLPKIMQDLKNVQSNELSDNQKFVLDELQLWIESILPAEY